MRPKNIVLLIAIILLAGGGIFYFQYTNRIVYNEEGVTGNTAGNLNNGGTFCEYDGKIYFANPYDYNRLYRMDSDCTHARKLNDDSVAYINVYGNYIYYVRNNASTSISSTLMRGFLFGLYRTNLDGSNTHALYTKMSGIASLHGNYIYYQHYDNQTALTLYRAKIDGSENIKLSDTEYNSSSFYNGRMYFSNITENHNIYTMDTTSNAISSYYEANAYMVDMQGSYIYYIDLSVNYALMRMNTSNKVTEQLCNLGKVVHYNLYGSKIFCQVEGDELHGIYRMNLDGSQKELVAQGDFNNISCTSQYSFFQYYSDPGTLYRVPTTGKITAIEEIQVR